MSEFWGLFFGLGSLAVFPVLISILRNEVRGKSSPYLPLQTIFLSVWLYVAVCNISR